MNPSGVIWIGHPDYLDENMYAIAAEVRDTLKNLPYVKVEEEISVAVTDQQAIDAARKILHQNLSGAIIVLASWTECNVVMSAVKELRGLPVLFWAFPLETVNGVHQSTGSYVSGTMINGPVQRLGLKSQVLLGSWRDKKTLKSVESFLRAAYAVNTLFYSKIGLFGYTSMSIYTGTFDHVLMRYLIGPEIEQMDSYSLIRAAEAVPEADVKAAIGKLAGIVPIMDDVVADKLYKTMALYVALKNFCTEKNWASVNVKCQYEFSKEYKVVPCVALSLLADDGVVTSCEGDMLVTVSQLILNAITGQVSTYGDSLSQEGNVIKFSPCGFMPFSLAAPGARVQKFMEHPGFAGIQVCGVMQPRRVTFLRLVEDVGSYHLVYGTGNGLPTEPRGGCMPALDVDLDGDANKLCKHYAGQHYALVYGDWADELESFAKLMGINTIRI